MAGTASAVADQSASTTSGAGTGGHGVDLTEACLPSGSLFFSLSLDFFFSCLELSPKHTALSASHSCLTAIIVDIQGFQVTLIDILVAQLGAANTSLARGKLTIEDFF